MELPVPFFVPLFHLGHFAENPGHFPEAFLFGDFRKIGIQRSPLLVLSLGGGKEVFLRVAEATG